MSEDEKRLIRLFRCLDDDARSETLLRLGKRLMMEAAVDPRLTLDENPGETARQELHEPIDERLQILKPIHSVLMDLLDYDFNVIEVGWRDASVSVADVIFGSGQNDDEFAGMLVEAYLAGANRYDVPLPCDFASTFGWELCPIRLLCVDIVEPAGNRTDPPAASLLEILRGNETIHNLQESS